MGEFRGLFGRPIRAVPIVLAVMVGCIPVAIAEGDTQVSGESDPDAPLTITPDTDPRVSANIDLEAGTRVFFIESMPKTMEVAYVSLGDFARASGCTDSPTVGLQVREFDSGDDLRTGTVVAESTEPARFGRGLTQVGWDTNRATLHEGHAYAFEIKRASGSCGAARQRSWAHNSSQVNGGDRACASIQDGSDRLRLWHEQGEDDADACATLGSLLGFDPPMPTGWTEVTRDGGSDSVNTTAGQCADALKTVETPYQAGIVCQFTSFTPAGQTTPDGWYYGLPWSGPGLDGEPRDIYMIIDPGVGPGAETGDADEERPESATLRGNVSPNGAPTSYRFEWGTDDSYGNRVPSEDASAGSGWDTTPVTEDLDGLAPGTTYHYRLVASREGGGDIAGEDRTFTTPVAPNNTRVPTVTGDPAIYLDASTGRWDGSQPLDFAYRWQRCDEEGEDCADIATATHRRYSTQAEDIGNRLRVIVEATNTGGVESAASDVSAVVKGAVPQKQADPLVRGAAVEGETLSTDRGRWYTDVGPLTYAYQWQRCDAAGNGCVDIADAESPDYVPVNGDVGHTLRVRVAANNHGGIREATSEPTAVVTAANVRNTEMPSAVVTSSSAGDLANASPGQWAGAGPLEFAYKWRRCDASGEDCVTLPGATEASYEIGPADLGNTLRVVTTARNSAGSATATSDASAVITATSPASQAAPRLLGTFAKGHELTVDEGSWMGTRPLEYDFQWQRCDPGGQNCADLTGETTGDYTPSQADVGNTLRAQVSATSSEGADSEFSVVSPVILASSTLTNDDSPTLSGDFEQGSELEVDPGEWTGDGTVSFAYQWLRCAADGQECELIDGATDAAYELTALDAGHVVAAEVIARDDVAEQRAMVASGASLPLPGAPSNTGRPAVSGAWHVGAQASATQGTWTTSGSVTYAYQWQACAVDSSVCEDIPGATTSTYELTDDDAWTTLRVVVRATDSDGTTVATSAPSPAVTSATPENMDLPETLGEARVGQPLWSAKGEWAGPGTINYAQQWERCDEDGENCSEITGETAPDYTPTSADVDATLRVAVTASNAFGASTETSRVTDAVAGAAAPVNDTAPTLFGPGPTGQTLTAGDGDWSGTGTLSYGYHWERCDIDDEQAVDCEPIPGATGASYTPSEDDLDSALRVAVTATDVNGSATARSASSARIREANIPDSAPGALTNLSPPSITGLARHGEELTGQHGLWSADGAIAYTYQWRRCDTLGRACEDIEGAVDEEYTLVSADAGATLRLAVRAAAEGESTVMVSDPTSVVVSAPPANQAPPTIAGSTIDFEVLTAEHGDWSGTGNDYTYQWQRCSSSGTSCTDIDGETESTFLLAHGDVGHTFRVQVTATNSGGSEQAYSSVSAVIEPSLPVGLGVPELSGTARRGEQLQTSTGSWDGTPSITFTYQWQRCEAWGTECTDIASATDATYEPDADDAGFRLRAAVTATNDAGSTTVMSAPSELVSNGAPMFHGGLTMAGTFRQGEQLTAAPGAWSGIEPMSREYQWQRCEAYWNCQDITGATGSTYTPLEADVGHEIRLKETVTNVAGSSTAYGWGPPIQSGAPMWGSPYLLSDPIQGMEVLADPGGWDGVGTTDFAYQWQRCDAVGDQCADIAEATGSGYTPGLDDLDMTLRVRVTASNSYGENTETSAVSAPVRLPDPVIMDWPPTISGHANPGRTLTADPGGWSGTWPVIFEYQWQRCDTSETNCVAISGATDAQYVPDSADVDSTIRVLVEATGPGGSDFARSEATPVVTNSKPVGEEWGPSIDGGFWPGQSISVLDPGEWSGAGPISYEYQWQRCDQNGAECEAIAGATDDEVTLNVGDAGHTLRVRVTATNSEGSASATSYPSLVTRDAAPANTEAPKVVGSPVVGGSVFGDNGMWTYDPGWYEQQWQRCDPEGENCVDIDGATSGSQYAPTQDDVGKTLVLRVTARSAGFAAAARSAPTQIVQDHTGPPQQVRAPSIEGRVEDGHLLRVDPGEWGGRRPLSYDYTWYRCSGSGSNCEITYDDGGSVYRLGWNDRGKRFKVSVVASNSNGARYADTATTDPVTAPPLTANLAPPKLTGSTQVEEDIQSDEGEWAGAITHRSYQWQTCNANGESCTDIPSANSSQFQPRRADVGGRLRVRLTVSGVTYNSLSATSAPSEIVTLPSRPVNHTRPTIVGAPEAGESIWVEGDTWSGENFSNWQYDRTYQWNRCDANGDACDEIPGATGSFFHPGQSDVGHTLTATVTVHNAGGSTSVDSEPSSMVPEPAPLANLTAPSLHNTQPLIYNNWFYGGPGLWAGAPDFSYQWQRCDPLTADPETQEMDCVDIPGQTEYDIYPGVAEVGHRLRLKVTATTNTDTQTRYSLPSQHQVLVGSQGQPVKLTGPIAVGQTITAASDLKVPAGLEDVVTYKFTRLDEEWNRTELQNTTDPDYTFVPDDAGQRVEVEVRHSVWRADGAVVANTGTRSTTTAVIEDAPTNDAAPTIDGDARAGTTLTADPGTWHGGGGPLSYDYQWIRCDGSGSGCQEITDATDESYTLDMEDVGGTIKVAVRARHAAASGSAESEVSGVVSAASPLTNTAVPTITGTPREREVLTASPGEWDGDGPIRYAYQWQLCGKDPGSNCVDIPSATHATYRPVEVDTEWPIRVIVSATNGAGTGRAESSRTVGITPSPVPVNRQPPDLTVLGTPSARSIVTSTSGTWDNTDDPDVELQWRRCSPDGTNCEDIEGTAGSTRVVGPEDIGFRLQSVAIATNQTGSERAASALSPTIGASTADAADALVFLDPGRSTIGTANKDGSSRKAIARCRQMPSVSSSDDCRFAEPRISPNGKMIAVELDRDTSSGGSDHLVVMNFDGSAPRVLPASGSKPSWTPDGTEVLFTRKLGGGQTELATVAADGMVEDSVPLVKGPMNVDEGEFAPDGSLITYTAEVEGHRAIYVAGADGLSARRIPLGPVLRDAYHPTFTSDGTQIVFTATRPNRYGIEARELYAIDLDGQRLRRLVTDGNDYDPPAVSPDGRQIVTSRTEIVVTDHGFGISIQRIGPAAWLVNSDGSGGRRLFDHPDPLEEWLEDATDVRFGPGRARASIGGALHCRLTLRAPQRRRAFRIKAESFVKCQGQPELARVVFRACLYRAPAGRTLRDYGYQRVDCRQTGKYGTQLLTKRRVAVEASCAKATTAKYVTKGRAVLYDRRIGKPKSALKTSASKVIKCQR